MHPILDYMARKGLSQTAFAVLVGLSRTFISMAINGHCTIGMESARQIERRTNRGITVQELSDWDANA